jgi:hypothetical protein
MMDEEKKNAHDPVSMVGPYARIRIIAAVICFFIAFTVIGFRIFFG